MLKPFDTLGRFELRRLLGQGAQSTVWLAHDPRMEREVAIKVLHPVAGADQKSIGQWLQEARSVGRVKHANIVPVYEADIEGAFAYLVFEYVSGDTLAQLLSRKGVLPAREAVAYLMDVLDAIAVAHAEGVVHRDIKPSNILVDGGGRARIMDFGIAARVRSNAAGEPVQLGGTVGYLSPEAIGGAQPAPSMDLFACGLVLAELLMGKPLVHEADPDRAMYRLAHEQLVLPATVGADVDDTLRSLVNRALVRDPLQRFPDARSFFHALSAWRDPKPGEPASGPSGAGGTLEFLMRRMRHKSDFPAMSESVMRIQSMANSETESVGSLTNQILRDVALTNKLLRVVNSAHYARGGISTVSRAVNLVGFKGIRNMALSLVLLEHMQDKAHAAQMKDELVRSLLAGTLGAEMSGSVKEAEEAFIGSMFRNLGRLLTQFYFGEEAEQIRGLMQSASAPVSERAASLEVLGLSYENLGLGIANAWCFPESILNCMTHPVGAPPAHASPDASERLRWIAQASNEMADLMLKYEPAQAPRHVALVARKYARAVGSNEKHLTAIVETAKAKLQDMAVAMEIRVHSDSAADKVLHSDGTTASALDQAAHSQGTDSRLSSLELQATKAIPVAEPALASKSNQVAETLSAGIQDITNAMVEDFKLADVLRMILETMYRAMGFDRVIFCMRDARTEAVVGRFGLGEGVDAFVKDFKVPLKAATPDLFGLVCIKGMDSMISDSSNPRIHSRLPPWYMASLNAPTFLLLPLQVKGAPFGLIYADKVEKGALELNEKELALLRTLRNQAVMAFKQSR